LRQVVVHRRVVLVLDPLRSGTRSDHVLVREHEVLLHTVARASVHVDAFLVVRDAVAEHPPTRRALVVEAVVRDLSLRRGREWESPVADIQILDRHPRRVSDLDYLAVAPARRGEGGILPSDGGRQRTWRRSFVTGAIVVRQVRRRNTRDHEIEQPVHQDGITRAPAVNRDRPRRGGRAGVGLGNGGDGGCESAARAGAERLLVVDVDTASCARGAVAHRYLTDAARRGRRADLPGGARAVTHGGRGARARQLTDAARGGRDAGLAGGTAAVAGGRRGAGARELTDAARGSRDAGLPGGTAAVAGGRRGAGARELTDAARGGRDAGLPGGTAAVTDGRRGARARQLADAARGGRNAGLAGRTAAVAGGRRGAGARQLADAARGGRDAGLAGGTAAVTHGRRGTRARRRLTDAARGRRGADLSRGAGAVAGGGAVRAR